jgi:hypothetical protein
MPSHINGRRLRQGTRAALDRIGRTSALLDRSDAMVAVSRSLADDSRERIRRSRHLRWQFVRHLRERAEHRAAGRGAGR